MTRRRNAAFPPQLRDIETALDWAIKEGGIKYEYDFPENINSYAELEKFVANEDVDAEGFYKASNILDNADEYMAVMDNLETLDEITLYRAIMVPSLEAIRFKDVGIFWAFDADSAEPHWGDYSAGNFEVVLTGVTKPEHVDWKGSFVSYTTMGDAESEVRLDDGAPIQITAIAGVAIDPEAPLWGTA